MRFDLHLRAAVHTKIEQLAEKMGSWESQPRISSTEIDRFRSRINTFQHTNAIGRLTLAGVDGSGDYPAGLWEIYEWQIHTYAHLRSLLTTKPIIAGVLVYLNELVPTKTDFFALRRALKARVDNVILPDPGSEDEKTLREWAGEGKDEQPPLLSLGFRLRRAIRVIPISEESKAESLRAFDDTVARIEKCVAEEARTGRVIASWEKNPHHEPTCVACDSKTYCPDHNKDTSPKLPGVRQTP